MTQTEWSFTADHAAIQHWHVFPNPLPRSVRRPDTPQLLDGTWRFELDGDDRGLREQWFLPHTWTSTAEWPGAIEGQMQDAQNATQPSPPWQDHVVAWYERDFAIPSTWLADPDHLVQVTFGACGYETRVWLNGHPLKTVEGEAIHRGEYTSFSYELPPECLLPTNRLTVRIADSLDPNKPRGKQESHVYKRGGIWYQTISGPVRSVWVEPVERNRLRSRLNVWSCIEDRLVAFDLTTRVHDPGIYTLRVVVGVRDQPDPLAHGSYELALEVGQKRQRVVVAVPNAQLWSPATPQLYHLMAQLESPRGVVSEITAHFGLRAIEARGQRVYLNHEPLYLDGILYQPGVSSFEEIVGHMRAMQQLGCNLVRVHIAGIDPRIYDLADELGLLLWIEVPSPHSSTAESRANHEAELRRLLLIAASHPSVVICSLYNEDWGAQDIATNGQTRDYIRRMYAWLRLTYPQLLVVDNDGWRHVSVEGQLQTDLYSVHLYTPDPEHWRRSLDRLVAGETIGVAAFPLVVGDPFFYSGQTPLVISEWGGWGFQDYGGPADNAAKAARIREFKQELRQRPIAGDVYTQATNIEDEVNGVIDGATGALLIPPGTLRSPDPDEL